MAESGEVQNLTVRDGTAQRSKTKGPITFIATTTLSPGDMKDEDASRWFYFLTDDTQAQTQRVMEAAARRAKDPSQAEDKEAIIQKHRWAQVVLKNASGVQVIVPFADLIKLPSEDPHSRRLFAKILLLLQAVTFLCQFREGRHRDEVDGVTRVFADAEDWRIALPLIEAIVRQKYGCGDQADKDFFADVQKLGRGPFSIEDLAKKLSVSPSTVRRRIGKLPPSSFEKFWHQGMHMHSFHDGDHFSTVPGLPTYEEVRDYLAQPVPVKR